tara:strand:+ start:4846 stop:5379 length:534 start_codon:yes stop_codon:yes gene_type:complete
MNYISCIIIHNIAVKIVRKDSNMNDITKDEVLHAQQTWGDGVVRIGKAFIEKDNYEAIATEHVNNLYAYDHGGVLFKPTKAADEPFRNTKEKAVSYFVATNNVCSEDKGFAIQPWTKVEFKNHGILLQGKTAVAMGHYFFTDREGGVTQVEYTFGYLKTDDGKVLINVHHSSVPYSA